MSVFCRNTMEGLHVNYEKSHCAKLCRWRREHKRNYFGFLSFMRLHGITILVSGFMVVDTITGILRIPGRESKLLHVLHNGELLGTYSSDVQHFWDKTRCNVDWEDKISSFEHWTVKKTSDWRSRIVSICAIWFGGVPFGLPSNTFSTLGDQHLGILIIQLCPRTIPIEQLCP